MKPVPPVTSMVGETAMCWASKSGLLPPRGKANLARPGVFFTMASRVSARRQLEFVADDLGMNTQINRAIRSAHEQGVLTGAGLMLGQPGTSEAIQLLAELPDLQAGWHLHLCDSKPLSMSDWPWGSSPVRAGFLLSCTSAHRRLVRVEIQAQWAAFRDTGFPCRFINTHHHLHLHPFVHDVIMETVGDADGAWFRGGAFRAFGSREGLVPRITRHVGNSLCSSFKQGGVLPRPDTVWGVDRLYSMRSAEIIQAIEKLPAGLHEFIFHPGHQEMDQDLQTLIQLQRKRQILDGYPRKSV